MVQRIALTFVAGTAVWFSACSATRTVAPVAVATSTVITSAARSETSLTGAAAHNGENPWSELTRGVLLQACGSCHLPELPTTKAGALLVFNLEEEPWHGRLSVDQLRQIEQRTRGSDAIADQDKTIVGAFVACAVEGACAPAPG